MEYKTIVYQKTHDLFDSLIINMLNKCSFHHFETPNLISVLTESQNVNNLLENLGVVTGTENLAIRMRTKKVAQNGDMIDGLQNQENV